MVGSWNMANITFEPGQYMLRMFPGKEKEKKNPI